MNLTTIVESIRGRAWDLRVRRPGFLQSKHIVSAALTTPIELAPGVVVRETSNVWVGVINLYNQETIDALMASLLPAAFEADTEWPLKIVAKLKEAEMQKDAFVARVRSTDWAAASTGEKTQYVRDYAALLTDIQKYYAFAVPLTNYCEQVLKASDESLLAYAVQYEPLDVDRMSASLARIRAAGSEEREPLIAEHLLKYAWIKTNYNIVEPYTKEEVLKEIETDLHLFEPHEVPDAPLAHIARGLQAGIYLRNSMKEMSQQVWFSHEPFVKEAAQGLSLSREDALQLRPDELIASVEAGAATVTTEEIRARHEGFIAGTLDGAPLLVTGPAVAELARHFDAPDTAGITEVRGTTASKGLVVGTARIVANIREIGKLGDGEILMTSMTTPDFVVAMKRAGAIVTDEGGLSCHAAIVSRELRKPCVIGTKIATKVFKDGDRVEVNADAGTVRKL